MALGECKFRYANRDDTTNEIANFSSWWREQLFQYGINVNYYSKGYDLAKDDPIYAEDLETAFDSPREIIVGANITNDASMLSKFGIMLDSDMTIYVHIDDFKAIFGDDAEPKSGDIVELIEVGPDRPGGRGAPKYEVTDREDDQIPLGMNPLMAHFVWFLKLKRFQFSHEPGIDPEPGTGVVDDQSDLDRTDPTSDVSKFEGPVYTDHEDEVYGSY